MADMLGRRLEQVVEEAQAPGGMAGLNMLRQREQAEAALPRVTIEQTGVHAGRLAAATRGDVAVNQVRGRLGQLLGCSRRQSQELGLVQGGGEAIGRGGKCPAEG
jgi:hypothetical protein